jgi:tetratricopeptide (TPR) repeat protein
MIAVLRELAYRRKSYLMAYGVIGYLCIVLLWGCATSPSTPTKPRVGGRPGGPALPSGPPPPAAPGAAVPVQPRVQPPSATMVASAQWVEEASHAIDVGDYDRATSLLERAISVEPNNGHAFYYYGLAIGERGRPASALSLLQKAEILLQGNAHALGEVYAQMGSNLERLGRRQEAVQRYEQSLAQDPANPLARRRLEALRG